MVRRFCAMVSGLVLMACALPAAPPPSAALCTSLFQDYDRTARMFPNNNINPDDFLRLPPELGIPIERLRANGCITTTDDLAALYQQPPVKGPHLPVDSGAAIPSTVVSVGVVTSLTDITQVTAHFRSLGYRTRSIGAQELGQRIFIGPFVTEGALQQALEDARTIGFISPYPTRRGFRFLPPASAING